MLSLRISSCEVTQLCAGSDRFNIDLSMDCVIKSMFSFSVTPICKRTWIFHFQTISNLNSVRYNDTWPQITVNFWRSKFPNHKLRRLNIFKKLFWIDGIKISPEFVPWLVDLCELKQRLSKLAPCLEFGTSRLSEEASTWRIQCFSAWKKF